MIVWAPLENSDLIIENVQKRMQQEGLPGGNVLLLPFLKVRKSSDSVVEDC